MRKFFLHFFFWVVFFFMWNRIVNFYVSNELNRIYFSFLDVSLIASGFYVIYLFIMPDYIRRKKFGRLVLLSVLLTILLAGFYSCMMGVFLHHGLMPIHFDFYWNYADLQYNRFFIALLGVLAGCFVKLAMDRLEAERKIEIMEKERSQAELTYLKAQINPHFLFNSLNSLYVQMELNPEEAKGIVVSLADLLRYQLYECNTDFIPVARELAYLENYFNLQRIRSDNCTANLVIKGDHRDDENLRIAPFLLIPFLENAFKYVSDHNGRENYIRAGVDFVNNELNFYCSNTISKNSRPQQGNSHPQVTNSHPLVADNLQPTGSNHKGIGLINVRKRLELIYGNKFTLLETIGNGAYHVTLTLNLQ